MDALAERSTLAARSSSVLDRVESVYLKVLRAAVLAVATVLLLCALVWAAISLARVLRTPESVVEKPSVVAFSELVGTDAQAATQSSLDASSGRELRQERSYYDKFVKRYYSLYRSSYQPHLRRDDKRLTMGEFDDLTINSAGRLAAVRTGELDFAIDKGDLEAFLPVVTEASASKATVDRLARYRLATKKRVTTSVQRTRIETRRGWNPYSTACENWYLSPVGCSETRRVEVPYNAKVTVMRYPTGIASPGEVLKGYQDRYFQLLSDRRRSHGAQAALERQEIVEGQVTGWAGLSSSVMVVGAFLALMFFFLLVAIERHQRRIAATLP